MRMHTHQLSQWRKLKVKYPDVPLLNTTLGSGYKLLAPTGTILGTYKHTNDEAGYRVDFDRVMRQRMREDRETWLDICKRDTISLGCYCKPGGFCHRYILVKLFEEFCMVEGIPFEYAGELLV